MSVYKNIGQFIKNRREELELTQEDLAERIGVSPATISLYESAERKPDLNCLGEVAAALNTPLTSILDIEIPRDDLKLALRSQGLGPSQIEKAKEYIQLLKYDKRVKAQQKKGKKTSE